MSARKRSAGGTAEAGDAALDLMLTDAAVGGRSRFIRPGAAVGVAAGLARRPDRAARRLGPLGAELARVASGRSEVRAAKRDRRFADPAWGSSWLFRRLLQTHLAVGEAVDGLISDAELDWRHERQARFAAGNLLDALAPSNFPWSNPSVIKEGVDQGGLNLVRGGRRFVRDFPRLPSRHLEVLGRKEPGAHRRVRGPADPGLRAHPVRAADEQVRDVPLLFAPPTINKYCQALSGVFAWLRPNDLVWNYVINNYLMGRAPPAFDVLFWNQDTVRLAAGVHRDFIQLSLENSLTRAGALQVLGSGVDLGAVDLDSYIVAGLTDHIIPWENAYRSTQLLGGTPRFVLSTSGHIQALHCIRCSACLNSCPVYSRVGGHAYESVYPGPIGAILTPQLRGLENAPTLPWASSLCGACYEVCPVKIDIPSVLLHLRGRVVREYKSRRSREPLAMEAVGRVFGSQKRYEQAQKLARLGRGPIVTAALPGWSAMRGLPEVPEQSFREWWRSRAPRPVGGDAPAS